MQARAVRAAENLLEDDDLAEELDGLSLEEYAERKGVQIVPNPRKEERRMPQSRAALIAENKQLRQDNEELNEKLDAILDLAGPEDEEDADDEEEEEDDEE